MTHPDNWVQRQIDEMNLTTNDRLMNAIDHVNSLSKEEFAKDLVKAGYHEADLHMGAKYVSKNWLEELARLDQEHGLYEHQVVPVFKLYYDKTLRMSEGKLAAQVGHVVAHLTLKQGKVPSKIIVLEASHTKFESHCKSADYVQRDMGLTEVDEGTATVCGSLEFE